MRRLAILFLAAGVVLSGCGGQKPPAGKPPSPAVEVVEVSAPQGDGDITATGALKRRREMTLSFRIPGVITALRVDDGDTVRQGQPIAELDPATVEARLRQTAADLQRAKRDAARLAQLVTRGAISQQQAEAQDTAVSDAQAAYDAAAFDRRWASLVAPASGVVLARTAQVGEVVQPGQAVVTMADEHSPLVLRAPLSDRDIGRVKLGSSARVTLDSQPGRIITGAVSRIGQRAGPQTGAIEIEITLAARPGLRSGQIARAAITSVDGDGLRAGYARAPAEAVLEADGSRAFVMRYDPASRKAIRTQVRFGGFEGDSALLAGLAPDARLITVGAGNVTDGETVNVIDPGGIAAGAQGPRR